MRALGGLVGLPDGPPPVVKPKLLVLELWNVGNIAVATPVAAQACEKFDVTLLAKPFAADLHDRFWPQVKVVSFNAPWTAFDRKLRLWAWPWARMFRLWKELRRERRNVALSGRPWDPRDHLLLWLSGARARLGFPRIGSQAFLTRSLSPPPSALAPLRLLAGHSPRAESGTGGTRQNQIAPPAQAGRTVFHPHRRGPTGSGLAAGALSKHCGEFARPGMHLRPGGVQP